MNDPVLDDLGEPAPRLPADAQAGERRHPRALIDLAADVLIGACLGVALYFAAVLRLLVVARVSRRKIGSWAPDNDGRGSFVIARRKATGCRLPQPVIPSRVLRSTSPSLRRLRMVPSRTVGTEARIARDLGWGR